MSRGRKWLLWILGGGIGCLILLAVTGVLVLRSQWFYDRVHRGLVETVETATGGRVELGALRFDWHKMRVEVDALTLHGTEPADKPPLLRAESVVVGLKIISLFKRQVDIAYLDVNAPEVYLILDADGRTNIPAPKVPPKPGKPAMQTILDLAIGRFSLQRGQFEIASRSKTPFSASGKNLATRFLYDRTGPRYQGDLSIQPLNLVAGIYHPLPVGISTKLTLEASRITVNSARVTSGASAINLSGALENLAAPHGTFSFDASVSVQEATPVLLIPELHHGTVKLKGTATWTTSTDFFVASSLHGTDLAYRDPSIRLEGFRADGAVTLAPRGLDASGLHLQGSYVTDRGRAPVDGHIAAVALRGKDLHLSGVNLAVFGGSFQGTATILNLVRYSATGSITGIEARPVVAMYIPDHLLWNALAEGTVSVQGAFGQASELIASASLNVTPATDSAPVHGQISATYKAGDRTLDLGHSTVTLPSSSLDFAGILGRQMRVHLDTRDPDDLLPAIGDKASNLPVKLGGNMTFDGTVSGSIDQPQISGHTRVNGFSFEGEYFDSLEADADVSPANVHLRNGAIAQGPVHAQFQLAVPLNNWQTSPDTPVSVTGTMRGGNIAGLEPLLELKDLPISGGVSGSAEVGGTLGDPHVSADFQLIRGVILDEPYDRFNGHLNYTNTFMEVTGGQLNAGNGQAAVSATYQHRAGQFDTGHLHLKIATNARSLEQINAIQNWIPGLKGTVQMTMDGEADLTPPKAGSTVPVFHVTAIAADVTGHNLQLSTQGLGDAHLTVASQGPIVRAHLDSNAANSDVHGDGEWRLEGDYPGTANFTLGKLDLAQLHAWLNPKATGPIPFYGSAEGQLRVDGPLLQPQALKAQLTIPRFEFGPAAGSGLPTARLVLHNSGPIVASMTNNVVTVDSARLTGEVTDLSITGKIAMQQKSPLELHVAGTLNLALLHDFNPDFTSSGSVALDATVRGALDSPQVGGHAEFHQAGFYIEGVPNGISNANGMVLFTGDEATGTRGTIQSFTGETGGGKIELSGFVGYSGGKSIFRVHANAKQVRIRYPEGVSTVADASLNLTGTDDRSNLDGTISIVRVSFNPQSDFSSLLGKSAQPVETPAARTGLLGGMNFDIQINTSSDVQFQSALTQDVQIEDNLHLRGTFSNPAVLGRVNVTQGQLVFFGTKYTINQGSVQFYNPVRIDPILDIDLETKANGIEVTLNVSGPFTKPNLTPRSDPPLQFNEIVALLANGRSPTSDPTRLAQDSTSPQSWQQMGASALLGQALASPVTGRLQRFFGVSQLRIDPTLPGVEYNPQARLTLEQQVTPDITFTYIADVTSSNPQVVRVEWSFAKQWSVVALREENGYSGSISFIRGDSN